MKFASKLIGLTWTFNDYDKAKELFSSSGPFVIVINHQSSLDVLGLVTQIWPLAEGKYILGFKSFTRFSYFVNVINLF